MAKLSFTYYPNKSKKSKQGMIPIYLRIGYQKEKSELRLKAEITNADLSFWNERLMLLDIPNSSVNEEITKTKAKIGTFLNDNVGRINLYNTKRIRKYLLDSERATLQEEWFTYCKDYYKNNIEHNTQREKATRKNYIKALNHMELFLKQNSSERMKICDIDIQFVNKFKNYLLSDREYLSKSNVKIKVKGMTEVSANGIFKKFRTINDLAIEEKKHTINYFKKVKLSNVSPRKKRLSVNQVKVLYNGNKLLSAKQIIYKDIFLFSLFTGLSYKDASELLKSRLDKNMNGEIKLSYHRIKTDELGCQFLTPFAVELIEKYKNDPDVVFRGGVMPKRSNKELNMQLKVLGEIFNIPFNLCSHTARHSFRQLLGEAGIQSNAIVKCMMGQSNRKDIDSVYYEVTESVLLEAKRKFSTFLSENLLSNEQSLKI